MIMDHCKKMKCWVMMKHFMVGRYAWILKKYDLGSKKNMRNEKRMSL